MKEHSMEDEVKLLEVGMYLATKDGQYRTNGIIIALEPEIKVLTDFGNIITFSTAWDLVGVYEISDNWLEAVEISFPLLTVTERIQEQIALLTKAYAEVTNEIS